MICPKFPAETSVFGLLYTGWLKRLNASARNSSLKRSLIGVVLAIERSTVLVPGPISELRPSVPCRSRTPLLLVGAAATAFVSK